MQNYLLQAILPERFRDELGIIKRHAVSLWQVPQHRTFTDHQPEGHSERVITKLNALTAQLAGTNEQLSGEEAFIVLAAAYLHDIGMQAEDPRYGTPDEIRDRHHLISQEMILGSVQEPERFHPLGLSREFAEEVALVAAAHRKLDLSEEQFEPRDKGAVTIRLRLLSALLRLADTLDMDSHRVSIEMLKVMQVSQQARLHWWKCHYVAAVTVPEGVITVTCEVPDGDYEYLLKLSLKHELDHELDKVQPFLWPPIRLRVAPVKTWVSTMKKRMSPSDFALLRSQTEQVLAQSSQSSMMEIARLREREEQQASAAAAEARRVSGTDPPDIPRAIELHVQAANVFERIGRMQGVADEMEQVAALHLRQGDKMAAASVHEQLGQLYLERDEPFVSRVHFRQAVALTTRPHGWGPSQGQETEAPAGGEREVAPDPQAENLYVWRSLLTVAPSALLGEFDRLVKFLDETARFLQGRLVPMQLARLFLSTQLLFWSLQGQWRIGLQWAREWTAREERLYQDAPPEERDAGFTFQAFYEGSLCASHAGEHDLALEWIERSFALRGEAAEADAGLKFMLHSRRAYIRARRSDWNESLADFVAALESAELLGSEEQALSCLENAISVADRAEVKIETLPGMAERQGRLREIRSQVWRVQDTLKPTLLLDSKQLFDALSNHLITLHHALSTNNWRGVRIVHRSLATVYSQANRWHQALASLAVAGAHRDAVASIQDLAGRNATDAQQAGQIAASLALNHAASLGERYVIAQVVTQVCDMVPDESIEPIAAEMLKWCEEEATSRDAVLPSVVLPWLEQSAERLSQPTLDRAVSLARQVLDEVLASTQPHENEGSKGALNLLARIADRVPQSDQDILIKLTAQLSTSDLGLRAIGLLGVFATHLSEEAREKARQVLHSLATEASGQRGSGFDEAVEQATSGSEEPQGAPSLHQRWAGCVYLSAGLEPLPPDIMSSLTSFFVRHVAADAERARGCPTADGRIKREFRFNGENRVSWLRPLRDALSPEQVDVVGQDLLYLAGLADAPFPLRQDALAGLTLLVPRLPEPLRADVARVARECALHLDVSEMHKQLHHGANDPLERFKSAIGTPEIVRVFALDLVAECCSHFDDGTRRQGVACLLEAAADTEAEVRAAAIGNLGVAFGAMTDAERSQALLQLLLSMQDPEESVVSQANFAVSLVAASIPADQASIYLRRWSVLAREGSPQSQISTAHTARQVLAATQKGETRFAKDDLASCLRQLEGSPSYLARRSAHASSDN